MIHIAVFLVGVFTGVFLMALVNSSWENHRDE